MAQSLQNKLIAAVAKQMGGSSRDRETLDQMRDAASHGADAGWAGFTYTSDTVEFYDKHEELIWELLEQEADSMGSGSVLEFIGGFGSAKSVTDLSSFKNLLAWYALETAGRYLEDIRDRRG